MPFLYRIQSDEAAMSRWEVDERPLVVGRGRFADVQVPGDGRMSRAHFTIFRERGAFFIQDLNSTNGTWIDGEAVTSHELGWNDPILAGETLFSFEPGLQTVVRVMEPLRMSKLATSAR